MSSRPRFLISRMRRRLEKYIVKCVRKKYDFLKPEVIIAGMPSLDVSVNSDVHIEKGVLLNSQSERYPHGMHGPVRLYVGGGARLIIKELTRIHGSSIRCEGEVVIGKRCLIAANCNIMDTGGHVISGDDVTKRISLKKYPVDRVEIEDDVWLGLNVIVLPGVVIGAGSVIAANSVVSKSIPSGVIAGGVPAKVIKEIK